MGQCGVFKACLYLHFSRDHLQNRFNINFTQLTVVLRESVRCPQSCRTSQSRQRTLAIVISYTSRVALCGLRVQVGHFNLISRQLLANHQICLQLLSSKIYPPTSTLPRQQKRVRERHRSHKSQSTRLKLSSSKLGRPRSPRHF